MYRYLSICFFRGSVKSDITSISLINLNSLKLHGPNLLLLQFQIIFHTNEFTFENYRPIYLVCRTVESIIFIDRNVCRKYKLFPYCNTKYIPHIRHECVNTGEPFSIVPQLLGFFSVFFLVMCSLFMRLRGLNPRVN